MKEVENEEQDRGCDKEEKKKEMNKEDKNLRKQKKWRGETVEE